MARHLFAPDGSKVVSLAPAESEDGECRQGENLKVERERLILNVVEVVFQFGCRFFDVCGVSVPNLRPARQTRFDHHPGPVVRKITCESPDELWSLRTRADESHLS